VDKVVLLVGGPTTSQDPATLLRAFDVVVRSHRSVENSMTAELWDVGDGPLRASLEEYVDGQVGLVEELKAARVGRSFPVGDHEQLAGLISEHLAYTDTGTNEEVEAFLDRFGTEECGEQYSAILESAVRGAKRVR
jgi:hypothetical protein